jgi:hypothetical protein
MIKLDIKNGDIVLGGRFKNKPYIVARIGKDENNQPIVITNKGKKLKLLAVIIKKIMPKLKLKEVYSLIKEGKYSNDDVIKASLIAGLELYGLPKKLRKNQEDIINYAKKFKINLKKYLGRTNYGVSGLIWGINKNTHWS